MCLLIAIYICHILISLKLFSKVGKSKNLLNMSQKCNHFCNSHFQKTSSNTDFHNNLNLSIKLNLLCWSYCSNFHKTNPIRSSMYLNNTQVKSNYFCIAHMQHYNKYFHLRTQFHHKE